MKRILVAIALQSLCHVCAAADEADRNGFKLWRTPFGSGTPEVKVTVGTETAHHVAEGSYHVPNYLPGYPTAATIWPREVEVECDLGVSRRELVCDGYAIRPALGRGEYVFVRPRVSPPPAPAMPCVCCGCAAPVPSQKPAPAAPKKPLG